MQPKFIDLSSRLEAFPNYKLHALLNYHTCHIRGKKRQRVNHIWKRRDIKGGIYRQVAITLR